MLPTLARCWHTGWLWGCGALSLQIHWDHETSGPCCGEDLLHYAICTCRVIALLDYVRFIYICRPPPPSTLPRPGADGRKITVSSTGHAPASPLNRRIPLGPCRLMCSFPLLPYCPGTTDPVRKGLYPLPYWAAARSTGLSGSLPRPYHTWPSRDLDLIGRAKL